MGRWNVDLIFHSVSAHEPSAGKSAPHHGGRSGAQGAACFRGNRRFCVVCYGNLDGRIPVRRGAVCAGYDHGDHLAGGLPGSKDEDGDRFIEIWNLVFMQYEQVTKDKRINLPKPSVDTGMGLERIAALLQGTHDNYETDHFKKIISSASDIIKIKQDQTNQSSFRVIADHLRASAFLIAEGVLPSNEGRGYVLRRIMRRGMRHSHLLGSKEPVFYNLFDSLKNEMSGNYTELVRAESLIKETLRMEEEKFLVLLDRGIKILNDEISKIDKVLPGEVAFKLYDTYGFPLDLTEDILRNKSMSIDTEKFQLLMKESRELAKKNWKGSGDAAVEDIWFGIKDKLGATEFLGYESNQAEGVVLSLLSNNKEVNELKENNYLHNHARMWFASIWIFSLELPWQLGAEFFMKHLYDGDAAANTLGWRWVAGIQTQGKNYLASEWNIKKFTNNRFTCTHISD